MTAEELNAIRQIMQSELHPIREKLDDLDEKVACLDEKVTGLDERMANLEEEIKDMDTAIGMLAEWADNVSVITRVPFAAGK